MNCGFCLKKAYIHHCFIQYHAFIFELLILTALLGTYSDWSTSVMLLVVCYKNHTFRNPACIQDPAIVCNGWVLNTGWPLPSCTCGRPRKEDIMFTTVVTKKLERPLKLLLSTVRHKEGSDHLLKWAVEAGMYVESPVNWFCSIIDLN